MAASVLTGLGIRNIAKRKMVYGFLLVCACVCVCVQTVTLQVGTRDKEYRVL